MKRIFLSILFLFTLSLAFCQTVTEGPSWISFDFGNGTKCRAYGCFEKVCFGDRVQIKDANGRKFRIMPAAFGFATVDSMCGYLDEVYSRICATGKGNYEPFYAITSINDTTYQLTKDGVVQSQFSVSPSEMCASCTNGKVDTVDLLQKEKVICLNEQGFTAADPAKPTDAEIQAWVAANLGEEDKQNGTHLTYYKPEPIMGYQKNIRFNSDAISHAEFTLTSLKLNGDEILPFSPMELSYKLNTVNNSNVRLVYDAINSWRDTSPVNFNQYGEWWYMGWQRSLQLIDIKGDLTLEIEGSYRDEDFVFSDTSNVVNLDVGSCTDPDVILYVGSLGLIPLENKTRYQVTEEDDLLIYTNDSIIHHRQDRDWLVAQRGFGDEDGTPFDNYDALYTMHRVGIGTAKPLGLLHVYRPNFSYSVQAEDIFYKFSAPGARGNAEIYQRSSGYNLDNPEDAEVGSDIGQQKYSWYSAGQYRNLLRQRAGLVSGAGTTSPVAEYSFGHAHSAEEQCFKIFSDNQRVQMPGYGRGNYEATDISKKESPYVAIYATDGTLLEASKEGVPLPQGTTEERGTSTTPRIRFNTDTSKVEIFDGTTWKDL